MKDPEFPDRQNQFQKELERATSHPFFYPSTLSKLLIDHVAPDGILDPDDSKKVIAALVSTISKFEKEKQATAGLQVSLALYGHLCGLQLQMGRRLHKGGIAMQIGICFSALENETDALWFFTLAYIEDVFERGCALHNEPSKGALQVHFGHSDTELTQIGEAALSLNKSVSTTWFPEMALLGLVQAGDLRRLSTGAIPLNRSFLRAMLDGAKQTKEGRSATKETGDRYEEIACYLLMSLPMTSIIANASTHDHEIDVVGIQEVEQNTYLLDSLGRHFLVESKHLDNPVSTEQLNHFFAKVRFHQCTTGILFASEDISGKKSKESSGDVRNAELTRIRWLHQDGVLLLVVSKNDLKRLETTSLNFSDLLIEKYRSLRFAKGS
ncbi:MAG: restriction endonuclease [Verrucomicrobiae bacterium]|nr:restriction endonuclease [Verrucomicrobiae bacterium]